MRLVVTLALGLAASCSSAEPAPRSTPPAASGASRALRPAAVPASPRTAAAAPDRDRDGYPDSEDACPDLQPKRCCPDYSADPKKRGCPVTDCELFAWGNPFRRLFPPVPFARNSAVLLADSSAFLDAAIAMAENLERLERIGHTAKGEKAPQALGLRRAEAVAAALRAKKLGFEIRVKSAGTEAPVSYADSEPGLSENRRVEAEPFVTAAYRKAALERSCEEGWRPLKERRPVGR